LFQPIFGKEPFGFIKCLLERISPEVPVPESFVVFLVPVPGTQNGSGSGETIIFTYGI